MNTGTTNHFTANHFTTIALWIILLFILFFSVAGTHGLLHLGQINNELQKLEDRNVSDEAKISELRNRIFAIRESSHVLERITREELGMSKPSETVYLIPDSKLDQ